MQAATVICASGIAFWMRLIRATTQGGVQLGFDADVALEMSKYTAMGAASLLIDSKTHPEGEIDKVNAYYDKWVNTNVALEYLNVYEYRVPRSRFSGDRLDGATDELLYSDAVADKRAGSKVQDENTLEFIPSNLMASGQDYKVTFLVDAIYQNTNLPDFDFNFHFSFYGICCVVFS